jgi:hypothetical protein
MITATTFVLLGESPNKAVERRPDLWLRPDQSGVRHTANRLRDHAGWTDEQYLAVFGVRDNVARYPVRRWGKRAKESAAEVAMQVLTKCWAQNLAGVLCLGRRAANATFGANAAEPCVWHTARDFFSGQPCGTRVAWIPHTSGLCRWWNDAVNREQGRAFLTTMLREVFP